MEREIPAPPLPPGFTGMLLDQRSKTPRRASGGELSVHHPGHRGRQRPAGPVRPLSRRGLPRDGRFGRDSGVPAAGDPPHEKGPRGAERRPDRREAAAQMATASFRFPAPSRRGAASTRSSSTRRSSRSKRGCSPGRTITRASRSRASGSSFRGIRSRWARRGTSGFRSAS